MEIMTFKEVKEKLMESELGSATDSFNFLIVLKKLKDGKYKAYQVCVENGKDDTQTRDLYLSEYDILTEDIDKTYECDEVFTDDNEEVAVLTDIDGF